MSSIRALGSAASFAALLVSQPAFAQTFSSGSTGADGAFNPACVATPCTVSVVTPPTGVFNFTTASVPAGVTVTFTRNATNTPVTILARGNVLIAGTIDVSGARAGDGISGATSIVSSAGAGGPGGFDGGKGSNGIDTAGPFGGQGGYGLGPGGAPAIGGQGCGGAFGTSGGCRGVAYATAPLIPLIGGSGGSGAAMSFGSTAPGGGGGGGALLVASSGTLTLTGSIVARGGNGGDGPPGIDGGGGGSGGGARLIATTITGNGRIDVSGGDGGGGLFGGIGGGFGRIRLESFLNTASFGFVGGAVPSLAAPGPVTLGGNAPTFTISSIAGVAVPAAPTGSYSTADVTLPATTISPITIGLAATNIPPGTSVTVFVVGQDGGSSSTTTALAGTFAASTASATVAIRTTEASVVMATTSFTLTSAHGSPIYVDGEEVERARVIAAVGGSGRVAYVTKSGREIVVAAPR